MDTEITSAAAAKGPAIGQSIIRVNGSRLQRVSKVFAMPKIAYVEGNVLNKSLLID